MTSSFYLKDISHEGLSRNVDLGLTGEPGSAATLSALFNHKLVISGTLGMVLVVYIVILDLDIFV